MFTLITLFENCMGLTGIKFSNMILLNFLVSVFMYTFVHLNKENNTTTKMYVIQFHKYDFS